MISSLVQLIAPDEMRGRVMSVYNVAFRGGMPIGSLISGQLIGGSSVGAVLAVNGVALGDSGALFPSWSAACRAFVESKTDEEICRPYSHCHPTYLLALRGSWSRPGTGRIAPRWSESWRPMRDGAAKQANDAQAQYMLAVARVLSGRSCNGIER